MTDKAKQAYIKLLEEAEQSSFFGEIIFKYRGGQLYNIIKGQSLIPEDIFK